MAPIRSIDDLLHAHDQSLFAKYKVIKDQLMQHVQTRWCAHWPEGNDHGPAHIERVLANLVAILGVEPIQNGRIDVYELFLAAVAVVAHDIGVIDGRKHHAQRSAELIEVLAQKNIFVFDKHSMAILEVAIRCHSSSTDIELECGHLSDKEPLAGHLVRPKFVAALVRLSDELDEDHRRAERWVQDLVSLPASSRPYWEFCQRITGMAIGASDITFNLAFELDDVGRYVRVNDADELFLYFVAKKFAKINTERVRTKQYLAELGRERILITARGLKGIPTWKSSRVHALSDGDGTSPEAAKEAVERFVHTFSELQVLSKSADRLPAAPSAGAAASNQVAGQGKVEPPRPERASETSAPSELQPVESWHAKATNLAKREGGVTGRTPTRASLRRLMAEVLPDISSFDAFCLDHFEDVYRRFSGGMDRLAKENLLLTTKEPAMILEQLRQSDPEAVAEHEGLLRNG